MKSSNLDIVDFTFTDSADLSDAIIVEMTFLVITTITVGCKSLVAKYTWVRSFSRVNPKMVDQASLVIEYLPTVSIRALMHFVLHILRINMKSTIINQVIWSSILLFLSIIL